MGYINIVFQYYSIKRPMCHIAHLRNSSGQQRYDYSITLAKKNIISSFLRIEWLSVCKNFNDLIPRMFYAKFGYIGKDL